MAIEAVGRMGARADEAGDLLQLVGHLGLTGEEGFQRLQWLAQKLGANHPAVVAAKQGVGETALENASRDAHVLAAVESVHAAISKGFEKVDAAKVNAPLAGAAPLPGQTLQATALVHDAWLKIGDQSFENRAHFFAAAAEAMRRILVDNARRRQAVKHGGSLQRADWSSLDIAAEAPDEQILAVHEALERLAARDPLGAQLIKMRFFAGLPNVEAAEMLGLSERTAKRTWAYARAWLFEELTKLA